MPASRRMATYRRGARAETPRRSAIRGAVVPGLAWSSPSVDSARAAGLRSSFTASIIAEGFRPEHPLASRAMTDQGTPTLDPPLDGPPLDGPPVAGDETSTLLGSLERQRRTFAWKCGGLDSA